MHRRVSGLLPVQGHAPGLQVHPLAPNQGEKERERENRCGVGGKNRKENFLIEFLHFLSLNHTFLLLIFKF